MREYEAKYYPGEKSFLLIYYPYKGKTKKQGREVHNYGLETIFDSRSESLKQQAEDDLFIDDFVSNKIEFNWKGNKESVKRSLVYFIFEKTDRFITKEPS